MTITEAKAMQQSITQGEWEVVEGEFPWVAAPRPGNEARRDNVLADGNEQANARAIAAVPKMLATIIARGAEQADDRMTNKTVKELVEFPALTPEEAEAAFVALITILDKSGAPAGTIIKADDYGVSMSLHFSAPRARSLISAATTLTQQAAENEALREALLELVTFNEANMESSMAFRRAKAALTGGGQTDSLGNAGSSAEPQ